MSWEIEWTMWSVAPVLMIQSLDLNSCLINNLGRKMEWDKFGGNQKGLPKKLEEEGDEMELKAVKEGWEATKGIIDVMTEVA